MPGGATLWIKDVQGEVAEPVAYVHGTEDQERQVIILHVRTGDATINVVFRRGEFAKLCARPNDVDAETEVAVNIEMEEPDERD